MRLTLPDFPEALLLTPYRISRSRLESSRRAAKDGVFKQQDVTAGSLDVAPSEREFFKLPVLLPSPRRSWKG